jgi:hypothetical protein
MARRGRRHDLHTEGFLPDIARHRRLPSMGAKVVTLFLSAGSGDECVLPGNYVARAAGSGRFDVDMCQADAPVAGAASNLALWFEAQLKNPRWRGKLQCCGR